MYKRLFKKSTAIILASALIFSGSTVYAQAAETGKDAEPMRNEQPLEDSTQKKDNKVSKDEKEEEKNLQEKTGKELKEEIQDQEKNENSDPGEKEEAQMEDSGQKEVTEKSGDTQKEEKVADKTESSDVKILSTEEVKEEETTKTAAKPSVSITGASYTDEAGAGIENIMVIHLNNSGTEPISITSADYELEIMPVGESAGAGISLGDIQEELDYKGADIQPGRSITLYPNYTLSQEYTGKTIDYTVQLIEKESHDVVAESPIISTDVFSIEDGVLKYHDTAKGEKYLITFDMGEGVTFEGDIGGGGGNSTVVGSGSDIASYQYYLDPGHPSAFIFGTPEGTSIVAELIPSDAGTAEEMWLSSPNIVSIDLYAPATLKVRVTDQHTLYGENGFSVSSPTTDPNAQILLGSELKYAPFADQTAIDQIKEAIDTYAKIQGYTLEIVLPGDWEYTKFIPKGEMTVTIPLPEGWDPARTEIYTTNSYGFNSMTGTISEDGKSISFSTTEFAQASTLNCVLMERSIPTEVKDWERVISKYYETVRAVNWFREPLENHYFDAVPPANDAAYLTYHFSGKFYADSSYYHPDTNEIRIPYDDFAWEVAKYFKNMPDLTKVDIPDYMYYEETGNQFVLPVGGGAGDSPYTYTLVDIKEAGGVYALWFEIAEENAQCTLMVEDNGSGDWRYLAFMEGFQEPEGTGTEEPEKPNDTEKPENPIDTEQPENPNDTEQPENPNDTEQPENTAPGELSSQQIQNVIRELQNSEAGESIAVSMGSATIVPEEILENAKGKDIALVLEMEGYTWTIYGKDITAADLKDIDLEVRTDINAVPEAVVKELAGENPAKQITLTHNGNFGFKAVLKIYIGTEYAGKYGNLFWFKSATTSEQTDRDEIDAQGYGEFTFTHASDYVIVISDKVMSDNTVKGQKVTIDSTDDKQGSKDKDKTVRAVKTGDSSNTAVYLGMLGLAGFAFAGVARRKKKEG